MSALKQTTSAEPAETADHDGSAEVFNICEQFGNEHVDLSAISAQREKMRYHTRNLIGFWILGLCNNYGYVVMLSAAFDLLDPNYHVKSEEDERKAFCNPVSTGTILIADILPALIIKMIAPFVALRTRTRVTIVIIFSVASLVVTALSTTGTVTYMGVICASISSGLGEVSFLSYSSFFDVNVVSTWSSGTGAAGVFGSISYAGLRALGFSARNALLLMLIVPIVMAITYSVIIVKPPSTLILQNESIERTRPLLNASSEVLTPDDDEMPPVVIKRSERDHLPMSERIRLVKPLLKYMIPLSLVYLFEYLINQGLFELIYFPDAILSHPEQYHWYQVAYQIGVLISRSSVNFYQIKKLWILPTLQFINVIILLSQSLTSFLPTIWFVLLLIFYEGLLGGAAYVNTFHRISIEVPQKYKEFSMGVASLGDSTGITIAGFAAIPLHNFICAYLKGKRE